MFFENILVVGCGGTGSKLPFGLQQIIQGNYGRNDNQPMVRYLDGDTVEASNKIRQDFFGHEELIAKAEAIRRRHLIGGHMRIDSILSFINTSNIQEIMALIDDSFAKPLMVIAAVDNINTRVLLLDWLMANHKGDWLWISPGNATYSGQVITYGKINGAMTYPQSPREAFPDYANVRAEGLTARGTAGCGMDPEGLGGTQTMMANTFAANLTLLSVVAAIEKDLVTFSRYFGIDEGTFNVSVSNSTTVSIANTPAPTEATPEEDLPTDNPDMAF